MTSEGRALMRSGLLCFARIKTAFEMNNIQRCDVNRGWVPVLWALLSLGALFADAPTGS